MKNNFKFFTRAAGILCALAFSMSLTAAAQDLKPAKDKATKKYGYQAKGSKNWVIPPSYDDAKKFVDGYAEVEIGGFTGLIDVNGNMVFPAIYDNISKFDKFGYCELMRKVDGVKLRGIADRSGRIIIPVQCRNVDVDRSGYYIYAKYDTVMPGFEPDDLWAVYDNQGREIFPPQFYTTPSFYNGVAIARDGKTGLYGMISDDGSILKPFKFFSISHYSTGFRALGTDLSHHIWSPDLKDGQMLRQPGAIIPYDPKDDPVRAAAWRKGPVGIRLHSNNVKLVDMHVGFFGTQAACRSLDIDWGFGRFIRLEPCIVPAGTPDAMYYGSGNRYYTLKAILYEADGSFVREVCSRGWIEGDCTDGAFYNAGGKEVWMILANPNTIALPAFTTNVHDYRAFDHRNIFEGLGVSIGEVSRLCRPYEYRSRIIDIFEAENIGVNTYIPRVPSAGHARSEFIASKAPIFHYPFRMGEVVNCVVVEKDGVLKADLSDDLVMRYRDRLDDPGYSFSEGSEVIFWGPNNARTIKLNLEVASYDGNQTKDDVHGTGYSYVINLDMYEEDGTWLRTIASAPWVDFVQDGVLIFQPLGIALISPFAATPHGKGHPGFQPNHHVPGQYPPSAQPQNGHYGQGQHQTPAQPQKPAIGTNRNSEANRGGTTSTGGARNSVAGAGTASSSTVPGAGAVHGAGALPGAADGHHAPMHGLQPLPHTLSALESALRYGRY